MFVKICFLLALLQGNSHPVRYVDLAAVPTDLPIHRSHVDGCTPGFNGQIPRPAEFCYPFPVQVNIIRYKPGAGYTKASLVVEVTNHSKKPVTLPVGVNPMPAGGEASQLTFTVTLENVTWSMGFAFAYADTGAPASLATIQPGEGIEYEIPAEIGTLKKMVPLSNGTTVPVVVMLGFSRLKQQESGDWMSFTDTNPIPSSVFRIPYPN